MLSAWHSLREKKWPLIEQQFAMQKTGNDTTGQSANVKLHFVLLSLHFVLKKSAHRTSSAVAAVLDTFSTKCHMYSIYRPLDSLLLNLHTEAYFTRNSILLLFCQSIPFNWHHRQCVWSSLGIVINASELPFFSTDVNNNVIVSHYFW